MLSEIAQRCRQREIGAGQVIAAFGNQAEEVYLLAHGRVEKVGTGPYGDDQVLGFLADGAYFGEHALLDRTHLGVHGPRGHRVHRAHPVPSRLRAGR